MAFPTTLDDLPSAATLAGETLATTPHSTLHGNLGLAIEALEAKVGVDASAVTTSHDYKIAQLESGAALLAGRAGGQTLIGGTGAGEDHVRRGTSHATPGKCVDLGTLVVRQIDGTAGRDEGRFAHDGTILSIQNMESDSGGPIRLLASDGTLLVNILYTGTTFFGESAAVPLAVRANSGGDSSFRVYGEGQLELVQVASGGSPSTNSARIYAQDVAGTAEIFVKDEAATGTQISPHNQRGPASLYDLSDPLPHVVEEHNDYLGGVRYLNMSRACMLLEDLLKAIAAGNTLTQIRTFLNNRGPGFIDIYRVEPFAAHNARLGLTGDAAKTQRSWATDQDAKQLAYDTARAAEQTRYVEWVAAKVAHDAARGAEILAYDAWIAAGSVGTAPSVRPPFAVAEPTVRPAADIRKALPAWLAARGVSP